MSFFLKNRPKAELSQPEVSLPPDKSPLTLVKSNQSKAPSSEGLAIANRLANRQVVVSRGFTVTADHFSLQGQALIEGSLISNVQSIGSVEVLPEGSLAGTFLGHELLVSGQLAGEASFQRLHLRKGAVCRGMIEGRSVTLDEGAILEASCRFVA